MKYKQLFLSSQFYRGRSSGSMMLNGFWSTSQAPGRPLAKNCPLSPVLRVSDLRLPPHPRQHLYLVFMNSSAVLWVLSSKRRKISLSKWLERRKGERLAGLGSKTGSGVVNVKRSMKWSPDPSPRASGAQRRHTAWVCLNRTPVIGQGSCHGFHFLFPPQSRFRFSLPSAMSRGSKLVTTACLQPQLNLNYLPTFYIITQWYLLLNNLNSDVSWKIRWG